MNTATIKSMESTIHSFGFTSGASLSGYFLQGDQNQSSETSDLYWHMPESQFMDLMADLFDAY